MARVHSTVTLLARFRGLSTLHPRVTAAAALPAFADDSAAPSERRHDEKFRVEYTVLGETADAVVQGDGLDKVLDKRAGNDRDRVRKVVEDKHEDLAGLVKRFR